MEKQTVITTLHAHLEKHIAELQELLADTSESVNEENKSVVGDKHETARAMAQIEQEKLASQLDEAVQMLALAQSLEDATPSDKILMGSLVRTGNEWFYLSVPAGKLEIGNQEVYALSPLSPIGHLLMEKKIGESFSFNNVTRTVDEIL